MPTSKPLRALVPDILEHIKVQQRNQTVFEKKVLDIYEGNLQKYLEESLREEFSGSVGERAVKRLCPINVLPRLMNKISQVYTHGVMRSANDNDIDIELLGYYVTSMGLDTKLDTVNRMINMFKYCAVEPYHENKRPKVRVLPPTQFTVYSDDIINPQNMTVFIKYMGKAPSSIPRTDTEGNLTQNAEEHELYVDTYFLYSDNEFLVIDSEGAVRNDIMEIMKNPKGINPLGTIPFIYINTSEFRLIPIPDQDRLTMPILIPKLLTDLNYATKFQSHAILYGINLDFSNLEKNPDSFWDLQTKNADVSGSVGAIKPEVDVEKVLKMINAELTMWMESMGIKANGNNTLDVASAASGISKAIDEVDVTNLRSDQKKIFANVEDQFWALIPKLHTQWVTENNLEETRGFSGEFRVDTQFEEAPVIVDNKKRLEEVKMRLDNKLTSYKRALSEANPELEEEEILLLMEEIEEEKMKNANKAMEIMNSSGDDKEEEEEEKEEDDDKEQE